MPQYDAYEDPLPEIPGDIIIVESTSFTTLDPIDPPNDTNHQGPRVKGAHEGARIKSGSYDESHNDPFHSQMTSHGRGPHVAARPQAASSPSTASETEKRDLAAQESLRQEDDEQVRMALEGDARKFGDHHHHQKQSEASK